MRGGVTGVVASQPIEAGLPAMLRADDFTQRFVSGLDEVLAPILLTIDNLGAYVDPDVAPMDFVAWLASWFGLDLDPTWDEVRSRRTVGRLASASRRRGTVTALRELAEALADGEVEVEDGGAVHVSLNPQDALPGSRVIDVTIRGGVDERHLPLLQTFVPPGRRVVLSS